MNAASNFAGQEGGPLSGGRIPAPRRSLGVLLLQVFILSLLGVALAALLRAMPEMTRSRWSPDDLTVQLSAYALSLAGVLAMARLLWSLPWRGAVHRLGFKRPSGRLLAVGLAGLAPVLLGRVAVAAAYGAPLALVPGWPATALKLAVGAGVYEEALGRGYVFQYLRPGRSFFAAAGLSGVVWALGHMVGLPLAMADGRLAFFFFSVSVQAAGAVILAFPSAYLFERGGGVLWGWSLTHFGIDFLALTALPSAAPAGVTLPASFAAIALSGLVTCLCARAWLPEPGAAGVSA